MYTSYNKSYNHTHFNTAYLFYLLVSSTVIEGILYMYKLCRATSGGYIRFWLL